MQSKNLLNITLLIILAVYSFYINFYYANFGVFPIDTFTFFDTGYSVTMGKHPIKDFWIISGLFGDYVQAFFFKIFGFNWNSYIYHSSTFNLAVTIIFYLYLKKLGLNYIESFIFSLSFATLCYPVAGTPFTYIHSYILSIISICLFSFGVLTKKKIFFFLLPILMSLSFLSMQLPAGLINLILIFALIYYAIPFKKNLEIIKFFVYGSFFSLTLFIIYLLIIDISFKSFLDQYILFPYSFGLDRIFGVEKAFEAAKLTNKLNFKSLFLDFKFINIFLFSYIIFLILNRKKYFKNIKKFIILDLIIIISVCAFIFHQLITANQIFIFSLIPFISSIFYYRIKIEYPNHSFIKIIIITLLIFSTIKFHYRFNEGRKFMELQNIDFSKAINASNLDQKFSNLKWISPSFKDNPSKEIKLLKDISIMLKSEKRNKMVVTHYQFFSLIINEDLNIPNRWYYPDNTFPASKENAYFNNYKSFLLEKIKKEKISVIYIVMNNPNIWKDIYLRYFDNNCSSTTNINEIMITINIKNCL